VLSAGVPGTEGTQVSARYLGAVQFFLCCQIECCSNDLTSTSVELNANIPKGSDMDLTVEQVSAISLGAKICQHTIGSNFRIHTAA
jgi:hypothetical protein